MKKKTWIILLAAALVAVALVLWLKNGKNGKYDVVYETDVVAVRDITNSITATGTVEPVTEVEVGTQVSGIVSKLYVDYNSVVTKGQVIAELDRTNLQSELASAKNNLASAKSEYDYQLKSYNRMKTLHDKQLVSDDDLESAELSYLRAKNTYEVNKNNVVKAQTNLGYATIYSPIDGVVLSKSIEEGQTVASSFNTPTLFTIAADLTDMRVIADIDEADIGGVQEGQRVSFTVDAYPYDTFEGTVTQVRLEPTTTSSVVTYEVVISAPNPDLKLKPGLTANVSVYTMEAYGRLSVPSKALRYTPKTLLTADGETIEDCTAATKVWSRQGSVLKAYAVETGVTNGSYTEVLSGVTEGMQVILNASAGSAQDMAAAGSETNNPFMPAGPGSKKK